MLQDEHLLILLSKIYFDTAENEPREVCCMIRLRDTWFESSWLAPSNWYPIQSATVWNYGGKSCRAFLGYVIAIAFSSFHKSFHSFSIHHSFGHTYRQTHRAKPCSFRNEGVARNRRRRRHTADRGTEARIVLNRSRFRRSTWVSSLVEAASRLGRYRFPYRNVVLCRKPFSFM